MTKTSSPSRYLAITAEQVRAVLFYDERGGDFYWVKTRNGQAKAGSKAGCLQPSGYVKIRISIGSQFFTFGAHRLAWLLCYGKWPDGTIDHIDGLKSNNRIANLRDVTVAENQQNQKKAHSNSRSGLLGAHQIRPGRWQARIRINGKDKHLGVFPSPEGAHEAYVDAKRRLHPAGTL